MVEGERSRLLERDPPCFGRIVGPPWESSRSPHEEHDARGGSSRVPMRTRIDSHEPNGPSDQARLFAELAGNGLFYRFLQFDEAPRQRPPSLERRTAASYEEYRAPVDPDRIHGERRSGSVPRHECWAEPGRLIGVAARTTFPVK